MYVCIYIYIYIYMYINMESNCLVVKSEPCGNIIMNFLKLA